MPIGFSDSDYVDIFKKLYEYLWIDIEREYSYWQKKNNKIIQIGKKSRYNFPKPENFILQKSIHIRKRYNDGNQNKIKEKERQDLIAKLEEQNQIKLEVLRNKEAENLKYTQEVELEFIQNFIDKYFILKNISQDVINEKFEIIQEVSKYKNKKTIQFLQKINANEQNFSLKTEAFKYLQQMNEKVILRRKRNGKKRNSTEVIYEITDSPDILIEKIYSDSLENIKEFDCFLSHSSNDSAKIIQLYKQLNRQSLHVYIDWVNDRFALKRNMLNFNTANVILQRLNKSKGLIYFHSKSSINSQWTAWEIGYFHGLNKKICVYNPSRLKVPEFLKIYPTLIEKGDELYIQNKKEDINLYDWLINNKTNGQR
jgi:hypothetical protein